LSGTAWISPLFSTSNRLPAFSTGFCFQDALQLQTTANLDFFFFSGYTDILIAHGTTTPLQN
jgi:hypothetical protein